MVLISNSRLFIYRGNIRKVNNLIQSIYKKVNDMSNKIELMKAEIETLVSMTEEEACREYNVDSKVEAVQYIIDFWVQEGGSHE